MKTITVNIANKSVSVNAPRVSEVTNKLYFVGVDEVTGVMVVTGAIQDIKGLDDVKDIWARDSNDARSIYNSLR